jgi:hypothetical protein
MTQAFLIVVRVLVVGLLLFWAYRLWTGTQSWTSRILGMFFSVMLIWQTTLGTWT